MKLGGSSIKQIIDKTNFKLNDFAPYIPPAASLEKAGVEFIILDTIFRGIHKSAIIMQLKIRVSRLILKEHLHIF